MVSNNLNNLEQNNEQSIMVSLFPDSSLANQP